MCAKARKRMLWIEDSAHFELAETLAPVYYDGRYTVHLAETVTDAIDRLSRASEPYDAVIVDIRLPPGEHKLWQKLYALTIRNRVETQLGLVFLYWLVGKQPLGEDAGKLRKSLWQIKQASMEQKLPDVKKLRQRVKGLHNAPADVGGLAVFTVEGRKQICSHLRHLGIEVYAQKKVETPDDILLRLAEEVIASRDGGGKQYFGCKGGANHV